MSTELLNSIQAFDKITIFRHVNPDGDALGAQFGLMTLIKDTYPLKEVYVLGDDQSSFQKKLFPSSDIVEDELIKESLAIIVDTANHERIDDQRYILAKKVIKIDHHIIVDQYGDLNIVDEKASSTCEILTSIIQAQEATWQMTSVSAKYLMIGLITDSGRFLHSSTSSHTFMMAAWLMSFGIRIDQINQAIMMKKARELKVQGYIYEHYQATSKGVAYYVLTKDILAKLGISREEGSDYVNTLSMIEEYPIWMAVTEAEDHYRVSIRARGINIREVAATFNGGGHLYASGAKIKDLNQLSELLNALDALI